jgi:hypothetical protein
LSFDDSLRKTVDEMNDPGEDGCQDSGDGGPGPCPLGQTVDERSLKDGYGAETVVVGQACGGHMYAVTVSEKNSVGFLYNIDSVSSPVLEKVFHLSPSSETMSAGIAYIRRELGEIDSETIQFLPQDKSPTGKDGVLFSGAFSGTTSFWEFDCGGDTSSASSAEKKKKRKREKEKKKKKRDMKRKRRKRKQEGKV